MPDPSPPTPTSFNNFVRTRADALRKDDVPPADRKAWDARRATLRDAIREAVGPWPAEACPLEPTALGRLDRDGYTIELLAFQTRPDVWATASVYCPKPAPKTGPAVLVVHGHWPWGRRDPVVQSRCVGLVKQGFFVLALDAFGSGERFTKPDRGTYHGALYGSTLWPTGQSLLGLQVHDNRRALDYLITRPEVDGKRIGVTGASGGGNQSMYAGALDDRLACVVPVCSVGNYRAYLKAACCVCEVLPGALRFTEEGDVLGLVAPRPLLVISAARDAVQFSPAEAERSLERAKTVYGLHDATDRLRHRVFDAGHGYDQAMREAMYGWMLRWLAGKGDGGPVPEPELTTEKPEDLACYPDLAKRPKGWLSVPAEAARHARTLLARPERADLAAVLGGLPKAIEPRATGGKPTTADGVHTTPLLLEGEPGLPLPVTQRVKGMKEGSRHVILLHLGGSAEALAYPLAAALLDRDAVLYAPDLRATGVSKPAGDAVRDALDHNSAEHAVWLGRPLLGQWAADVQTLVAWLNATANTKPTVVGIGHAGVVALVAGVLLGERCSAVASVGAPATLVTEEAYGAGMPMGLLAPGLFRAGDVPDLAKRCDPRPVLVADPVTPQGVALGAKEAATAFASAPGVKVVVGDKPPDLAARLS
jgi:dienelactone hydrolase